MSGLIYTQTTTTNSQTKRKPQHIHTYIHTHNCPHTAANLRHRQAAECGVHVAHAREQELRGAVRPGHESASARGIILARHARGESRSTVDAHTAFVPDPFFVTAVLKEGVTVACSRLKSNHSGGAGAWNIERKAQMVQTRGLREIHTVLFEYYKIAIPFILNTHTKASRTHTMPIANSSQPPGKQNKRATAPHPP